MSAPLDLLESWQSGQTIRKHTMSVRYRETTAEHTWGLILILLRYWPDISRSTLVAAHLHDAGERATADIPATLCWELPELKKVVEEREHEHIRRLVPPAVSELLGELPPEDWLLIEIADRAEFVLSCANELLMGNSLVRDAIHRGYGKMSTDLAKLPDRLKLGGQNLLTEVHEILDRIGV